MKRILFFIVLIAVIYTGTALTSCKKNGPTQAVITVLDSNSAPVPAATVILWQDTSTNPITLTPSNVRVTGATNTSGTVTFNFANEAFLNIWAIKEGFADTAKGFIRLQQYQSSAATVRF